MNIIERKFAAAANLKTYFTGKACRNGHVAYRYTQSGACSECVMGVRTVDLRKSNVTEQEIAARSDAKQAQINAAQTMAAQEADRRRMAQEAATAEQDRQARRKAGLFLLSARFVAGPETLWPDLAPAISVLVRDKCQELEDSDIFPNGMRAQDGKLKVMAQAAEWEIISSIHHNATSGLFAEREDAKYRATPNALRSTDIERLRLLPTERQYTDKFERGIELLNGRWYSVDEIERIMGTDFVVPVTLVLTSEDIRRISGYEDGVVHCPEAVTPDRLPDSSLTYRILHCHFPRDEIEASVHRPRKDVAEVR